MRQIDQELNRYLTLVRNKIRERGFTQLEVQEALSWGRSYISQLLTRQKSLRVEQVLLILNVIGVEPAVFFAELHGLPGPSTAWPEKPVSPPVEGGEDDVRLEQQFEKFQALLQGLAALLVDKRIIASSDLRTAVEEVEARGDENASRVRRSWMDLLRRPGAQNSRRSYSTDKGWTSDLEIDRATGPQW